MEGNLVFSIIFPENTVPLYTQLSGEEPELLLSTMIYILRDTMEVPEIWHSHMWCLLKQAEFCSVKALAATAAQWSGFALGWTTSCNSCVLKLCTDSAQLKFPCLAQIAEILQIKSEPPILSTVHKNEGKLQFSHLDQHLWFTSHRSWIFVSQSYAFLNNYDCT